ncbi:signal peptidase II [Synechococcus sp. A15-28]|uniref:signal peptidase II n=1 Tax=Synechococcus sp. A15-28 TaxID=1050638 RepID=UPI00164680D3|nr:signal peptidase II [Synechococcus sp. A15-28]QNI42193.1 signal peptidase II [Synechococcus sp. A15-28]
MTSSTLRRTPLLGVAGLVVVVDQGTKLLASSQLADGRIVPLLPGLLNGQLVHNTGAAFSLLRGSVQWLGVLSLAVTAGLLIWVMRHRAAPFWQGMAVAFLLGGTLGNGIDRWRIGHVIDFLALVPINFPIFNPADVAINLAVLCFFIDLWSSRGSKAPS